MLIVDANMGAIGEDNSKACMHFLLRMLHTQMQRQVHLPETDRPRVPLLVDEAHYVAGAENVVDQIATHRRAGLETAFGLQYFAQLGSGSQHEEKIRKGVLNLLQSRFLFRMGDAQDAEEATRIAMAVYATMIRDDPDSRARLRVTPEQALNFPNHYCLASWIAMGARIPSFMGQTYAFPPHSDAWARHHLADLAARVAPYPEQLESTLDRAAPRRAAERPRPRTRRRSSAAASRAVRAPRRTASRATTAGEPTRPGTAGRADGANPAARRARRPPPNPATVRPAHRPRQRFGPAKREVRADFQAPPDAPNLADSPVRRLVGRPATERLPPRATTGRRRTACASSSSSTASTRSRRPTSSTGAARLPRLFDEDYAHPRPARPRRAGAALADRPRRAARTRRHRGRPAG